MGSADGQRSLADPRHAVDGMDKHDLASFHPLIDHLKQIPEFVIAAGELGDVSGQSVPDTGGRAGPSLGEQRVPRLDREDRFANLNYDVPITDLGDGEATGVDLADLGSRF
jgi:hypothetical protein